MRLRQRLKIQQNTPTQDSHGQPIESWSTYRTCHGNVKDTGGREIERGDGKEDIVDAVVEVRHPREGRIPVAEDRVVFDEGGTTRTFNITRVQRKDEQRRWLLLYVKEHPV
jgi:SPP1 family predicted phage head-tail adaptor